MHRALQSLVMTVAIILGMIFTGITTHQSLRATMEAPRQAKLKVTSIAEVLKEASIKSTKGRDITLLVSPNEIATDKRYLVQSGLHGDEQDASKFVLWVADRYSKGESLLNRLPNATIDFLPYANPDASVTVSRYNPRGVNLNRNFSVLWGKADEEPGITAFSEKETQAIQRLFDSRNYQAAVDVHGYINWVVAPSEAADVAAHLDVDPQTAQKHGKWLKALSLEMKQLPNYQLKTAAGLGDGGAFEDWAFWQKKVLAFCLEITAPVELSPLQAIRRPLLGQSDERFLRYEQFIHRMLVQAQAIDQTVASVTPASTKDNSPSQPTH